jgi:hypothetical protein
MLCLLFFFGSGDAACLLCMPVLGAVCFHIFAASRFCLQVLATSTEQLQQLVDTLTGLGMTNDQVQEMVWQHTLPQDASGYGSRLH